MKAGSAFVGRFLECETENTEEAGCQLPEKYATNGENGCRGKILFQKNQVNNIRRTHPGNLFQQLRYSRNCGLTGGKVPGVDTGVCGTDGQTESKQLQKFTASDLM